MRFDLELPQFGSQFEVSRTPPPEMSDGGVLEACCLQISESGGEYAGVRCTSVLFRSARLPGARFSCAEFRGCVFVGCDLTGSDFSSAYFESCRFVDCRMSGVNIRDAKLSDVEIVDCNCDFAVFRAVDFTASSICGSRFREAALESCKFRKCSFRASSFSGTSFFGTFLAGHDLSECLIEAPILSDDLRELRGARISREAAGDILSLIGIKVNE